MYWTDLGISKIQRVNLGGTGLRDLVATNLRFPRGIALDEPSGKIYWIDSGTLKIQRANLDGSGVEDLIITYSGGPAKGGGQRYGLALALGQWPSALD
jgi:sugar lactone lactonase YvrE